MCTCKAYLCQIFIDAIFSLFSDIGNYNTIPP